MTIVSIVSIILLALFILTFAIALRKKEGRIALRSASACGQLVLLMTIIIILFLVAQQLVAYSNAQNGLYEAEGIDLFYMSKAAGVFCLVALVATILCFVGSLLKKQIFIAVPATALVLVGIAVTLWALTKFAPTYYYAVLVPAALLEGWCLFVLAVNALFDSQKNWCKIVITVVNTINFVAVVFALVNVALIANGAFYGLANVGNIMVVVLALLLVIVALPSVLNFIVAVMDTVKMIKSAIAKSGD